MAAQRAPTRSPRSRRAAAASREEILVDVAQALALGGEALVAEALEQVAGVEARSPRSGVLGRARREAVEQVRVEIEPDVAPEPSVSWSASIQSSATRPAAVKARADEPEGLAEGGRGRSAGVRPELGGDRVAQPQAGSQGEEGR